MRQIECMCKLSGDRFSPSEAEKRTGWIFSEKNEPGQIGVQGIYRGRPMPHGRAILDFTTLVDCSEPLFLKWLDDIGKSIPAFKQAGAENIVLEFLVAYKYTCNLEAEPDFFAALARLGLPVTMSCWVDENLPDSECTEVY